MKELLNLWLKRLSQARMVQCEGLSNQWYLFVWADVSKSWEEIARFSSKEDLLSALAETEKKGNKDGPFVSWLTSGSAPRRIVWRPEGKSGNGSWQALEWDKDRWATLAQTENAECEIFERSLEGMLLGLVPKATSIEHRLDRIESSIRDLTAAIHSLQKMSQRKKPKPKMTSWNVPSAL